MGQFVSKESELIGAMQLFQKETNVKFSFQSYKIFNNSLSCILCNGIRANLKIPALNQILCDGRLNKANLRLRKFRCTVGALCFVLSLFENGLLNCAFCTVNE